MAERDLMSQLNYLNVVLLATSTCIYLLERCAHATNVLISDISQYWCIINNRNHTGKSVFSINGD